MRSVEITAPAFSDIFDDEETGYINSTTPRHERAPRLARRLRRRMGKFALGTTILTGTFTGLLQYDIQQGKEAVEGSTPAITHVYEPTDPEYNEAATVVLTGLGTRSAAKSTEILKSHTETGHVFALEYSNNEVDIDELTRTVVDGFQTQSEADGTPLKYVSFDGYSMGGIVLLAIAANIHENYPDLTVTSVSLNSTPVGENGLTRKSSEAIGTLGQAINACNTYIKLCSGIEYSPTAQRIVEIFSRHEKYYDSETHSFSFSDFQATLESVDRKLSGPAAPSPVLIYNQAAVVQGASDTLLRKAQEEFLVNYGVEQSVRELSERGPDKLPVSLFYTMSQEPSQDRVVDVNASSAALEAIADEHDARLEITKLDVGHANIKARQDIYNQYITEEINPAVALAIAREERVVNPGMIAAAPKGAV